MQVYKCLAPSPEVNPLQPPDLVLVRQQIPDGQMSLTLFRAKQITQRGVTLI